MVTYQEDNRDVQSKCHSGVCEENENTEVVDVRHAHLWDFKEKREDAIDDGTSRRIVVQGNERVHLEFWSAEDTLHHDQAHSFEDDTSHLDCKS